MSHKTITNHGIIFVLFIGGAALVVIGAGVLSVLIVPKISDEAQTLGQVFVLIAWILSWILRGLYISNRDLSINDMGEVTLQTYIGACQGVYDKKYKGDEK